MSDPSLNRDSGGSSPLPALNDDSNGSSPPLPILRNATRGHLMMDTQLMHLNIEPGDTRVSEKSAPLVPARGDTSEAVVSNIFGIKLKKQPVYLVNVEAISTFEDRKPRDIFLEPTPYDKSDIGTVEQRARSIAITKYAFNKARGFFGLSDGFLYDMMHILYVTDLPTTDIAVVNISPEETMELYGKKMTLEVKFKRTSRSVELDASVFGAPDSKLDLSTRATDLTTILEIATSQYIATHPDEFVMFNNNTFYFYNPTAFGYRTSDIPKLKSRVKYLGIGARKSCQLIEGPKGRGNASACLAIDSKKTVFLDTMNVARALTDLFFTDRNGENIPDRFSVDVLRVVKQFLTNKTVTTTHRNGPAILIKDLMGNAYDTKFDYNGRTLTVVDYFSKRYGKELRHPYWPLVMDFKKSYYPIEVLVFTDYQRLRNKDLTEDDTATLIRCSAKPPAEKLAEIQSSQEAFNFSGCDILARLGTEVVSRPLKLNATSLALPSVQYGNNRFENPGKNGKWQNRSNTFLVPAELRDWAIVLISQGSRRDDEANFYSYITRFIGECRKRGMTVQEPYTQIVTGRLDPFFEDCAAQNPPTKYIHFADPDRGGQNHSDIKVLEQQHSIITQCVKTTTIAKAIGKGSQTFENIVNKANMKLGGLNYLVVPVNTVIPKNTLLIGFGINLAAGGFVTEVNNAAPSIIGYAANDNSSPEEFTGNFVVQHTPGDEGVDGLIGVMDDIVHRFVQNRGGPPSRLIVYRHGCSDGQFGNVLKYEVPIIEKVVRNIVGHSVPLSVIVPNKMHDIRLFKARIDPRDRADSQNVQPGLVVDQNIVHPAFDEFYMVSHLALQGTARPTKYTILHTDDAELSVDNLKRITNALCFDFQIVTSPVSKPAPVYIAEEYAKRGRNLYNVIGLESSTPRGNGSGDGSDSPPEGHHSSMFERTTSLNFTAKPFLRDKRINA